MLSKLSALHWHCKHYWVMINLGSGQNQVKEQAYQADSENNDNCNFKLYGRVNLGRSM